MSTIPKIKRKIRNIAIRALGRSQPTDNSKVTFSNEAFASREQFRSNYSRLCNELTTLLDFSTFLDIGCANGFMLCEMAAKGKVVQGIEIAEAALDAIPSELLGRVMLANASCVGQIGSFDLVSCVEVAEHVMPEETHGLMDTIVNNASKWVYFTAASPFQPGHGHINCRQQFYWLNEFRKRGFDIDWDRTEAFIKSIEDLKPAIWLPLNSLILRRR
jgi:cyclopropane fatty-acyl-phospholipid synthase-like methyltransferase